MASPDESELAASLPSTARMPARSPFLTACTSAVAASSALAKYAVRVSAANAVEMPRAQSTNAARQRHTFESKVNTVDHHHAFLRFAIDCVVASRSSSPTSAASATAPRAPPPPPLHALRHRRHANSPCWTSRGCCCVRALAPEPPPNAEPPDAIVATAATKIAATATAIHRAGAGSTAADVTVTAADITADVLITCACAVAASRRHHAYLHCGR